MPIDSVTTHRPDLGPGTVPPKIRRVLAAGDAVALIATPIARALHLPCIDPATRQLRPESGCAKRRAAMNAALPNLNPIAVDNRQK